MVGLGVLIGGGSYLLLAKKSAPVVEPVVAEPVQEEVMTLTPADIGLDLNASVDKKKIIMNVANTDDIESLDYELSYTSSGNIPRGVLGNIEVKTKGATVKKEMLLGTCSDTCHYDQGVTSVKLVLKVTKTDGKIYSVDQSLDL